MATLTTRDVDQIVEGIEHFIMNGDPEVDSIWQPYVEKLKAERSIIAAAQDLIAVLRDIDKFAKWPEADEKSFFRYYRFDFDSEIGKTLRALIAATADGVPKHESARSCGCDPGANHLCEQHRETNESEVQS